MSNIFDKLAGIMNEVGDHLKHNRELDAKNILEGMLPEMVFQLNKFFPFAKTREIIADYSTDEEIAYPPKNKVLRMCWLGLLRLVFLDKNGNTAKMQTILELAFSLCKMVAESENALREEKVDYAIFLIRGYGTSKNEDEAIEILMPLCNEIPRAAYELGLIYKTRGDLTIAEQYFKMAENYLQHNMVKSNSTCYKACYELGLILWEKEQNNKEEQKNEEELKNKKHHRVAALSVFTRIQFHSQEARKKLNGIYDELTFHYQIQRANFCFNLANAYSENDNFLDAVIFYEKVIALDLNSVAQEIQLIVTTGNNAFNIHEWIKTYAQAAFELIKSYSLGQGVEANPEKIKSILKHMDPAQMSQKQGIPGDLRELYAKARCMQLLYICSERKSSGIDEKIVIEFSAMTQDMKNELREEEWLDEKLHQAWDDLNAAAVVLAKGNSSAAPSNVSTAAHQNRRRFTLSSLLNSAANLLNRNSDQRDYHLLKN